MKLETFFEKFELFAEAPRAVAKLRELVRHLAVTGRLVAQDIREESGELLLRRVDAERLAAAKARLISPMKPLPAVSENELPFKLQNGWAAARLIELVMEIRTGPFGSSLHKSDYLLGGTPVVNPASLKDGKIIPIDEMAISNETVKRLEVFKLCAGDIILARRGEMGRCAVVTKNEEGWLCGTGSLSLRMPHSTYAPYLAMLIGSPICRAYLGNASVGTTMQNLNQSILANMPIGIPPLAEQKRIVAKVDELMALCDRLEAQQQEREAQRAKLARASLARFAKAPTPANLVPLFHPTYNITPTDLRKSILTLAVQGKIVPQDPNDEPANTLLERITRNLSQEQIRRRSVSLSPLPPESLQYELPDSWTWAYFRDVAMIASNLVDPDEFLDFTHLAPDNIEKGSGVLLPCATVREDKVTSKNHRFYSGQIVYSKIRPNLSKVVVVDFEGLCSADMYPIDSLVNVFYLQLYMLSDPFLTQAVKTDTRVAMPKINQAELNTIAVPVPPLAEQRRIVAKVKELMAIADQLEAQLANEKSASTALLDAAIHGLLNPIADVIAFPAAQATAIDRAGIGCYVVQKLASHKTFGRVALMKHEYLAEAHVGATLDGQYQRQAAGPLDSWVYRFEEDAAREGWFTVEETKTRDGHKKIVYRKGAELDAKASAAFAALPQAQRDELDRLLKLLGGKPTEEVEIIATLFAVWNDFLIDGHSPSDENIVTGFREHWHEQKQKFTAKSLHTWLDWMRRNGLVPTGRGPRTQQHSKLDLH
jgi:type I restriction enzyme, S subunit